MFRENEIKIGEEFEKEPAEISALENQTEIKQLSIEERIGDAFKKQDNEIVQRENKHNKKVLSGLKKWIGTATIMGTSLLAAGCSAEKSSDDGFRDNTQQVVRQRLEQTRNRVKHMKKMQSYKPSKEAIDTAKEMNEGSIVQPIDQKTEIK